MSNHISVENYEKNNIIFRLQGYIRKKSIYIYIYIYIYI